MNILVVGGAGYLGGAVTDLLLKTKHQVKVYDALLYEETYRKKVDFVYGDVRDKKKLLPYLKWADIIIWLAALVGDGACALNPKISYEINTKSLQLLANINRRIIFTSTCSVYGEHKRLLNESSPVNPLSVYASTKLVAEKYLINKNALIFRIGTLFGLGDNYSRIRMDLVINTLTAKAFFENDGLKSREQMIELLSASSHGRLDPIKAAASVKEANYIDFLETAQSYLQDLIKLQLNVDDVVNIDCMLELQTIIHKNTLQNNIQLLNLVQTLLKSVQTGLNLNKQLMLESFFVRWADELTTEVAA